MADVVTPPCPRSLALLGAGPGPLAHGGLRSRVQGEPGPPPGSQLLLEISQAWVIRVQPHCSGSGSKADSGRRTGVAWWVDCAAGGGGLGGGQRAPWVFLEGVCVLRKGGRGPREEVWPEPLPSSTTAVSRPFFLLLSRSCVWHCWSRKLGRPLGQGGFSQTACSTLAPGQCVPPGPGLEGSSGLCQPVARGCGQGRALGCCLFCQEGGGRAWFAKQPSPPPPHPASSHTPHLSAPRPTLMAWLSETSEKCIQKVYIRDIRK